MLCRNMLLAFCGRLSDPFFVAGLDHFAAAWVGFVEQLVKEVSVPVFAENQFTLGRCGIGLCVANLEESRTRAVRATDFHHRQVGVVQHVDGVLTRGKFDVSHMELKWDVGFKVPNDLRLCFGWNIVRAKTKAMNNDSNWYLLVFCSFIDPPFWILKQHF